MLDLELEIENGTSDFARAFNASSSRLAKVTGYATIYEEISHCRNAIQVFEKKIVDCHKSILLWKSRHNTLSDISRLPDEILVEIWKNLAFNSSRVSTQWLRVTHVCSHWHRVALASPVLWSWPCLRRPEVAWSLLDRAGTSEFTMIINAEQTEPGPGNLAIRVASVVLPRTKVIHLNIPKGALSSSNTAFLRKFFSRLHQVNATHTLRHLEVHNAANIPTPGLDELHSIAILRKSPHLETIHFSGHNFFDSRSELSSLYRLTELQIIMPTPLHNQRSSVRRVLETLKHLSNLKILSIVGILEPLEAADLPWYGASPPVLLPALQKLWLGASIEASQHVLDRLHYPLTTWVEVDLQSSQHEATEQRPERDSHALLDLLATTTHRITPSVNVLNVYLHSSDRHLALCFTAPTDNTKGKVPYFSVTSKSGVYTFIPPSMASRMGVLVTTKLPAVCPLNNLSHLDYQVPSGHTGVWKAFGALPSLRSISFHENCLPTFIKVYASICPSGESVFEPWDPKTGVALYFSNVARILTRGDSPEEIAHLLRNEELRRIRLARQRWRLLRRRQEQKTANASSSSDVWP